MLRIGPLVQSGGPNGILRHKVSCTQYLHRYPPSEGGLTPANVARGNGKTCDDDQPHKGPRVPLLYANTPLASMLVNEHTPCCDRNNSDSKLNASYYKTFILVHVNHCTENVLM